MQNLTKAGIIALVNQILEWIRFLGTGTRLTVEALLVIRSKTLRPLALSRPMVIVAKPAMTLDWMHSKLCPAMLWQPLMTKLASNLLSVLKEGPNRLHTSMKPLTADILGRPFQILAKLHTERQIARQTRGKEYLAPQGRSFMDDCGSDRIEISLRTDEDPGVQAIWGMSWSCTPSVAL